MVGGSFGFPKLMEKLGVERRIYTSGERKAMLDPFQPEKPEDVKRIKAIQKDIHEHFIALVKERRGTKLRGTDKILFSGEFWTAQKAIDLGLADSIGDLRSNLRAALRRQGAHAADRRRTQPARPQAARRRRARGARRGRTALPPTCFRRWKRARFGAVTACEGRAPPLKCLVRVRNFASPI